MENRHFIKQKYLLPSDSNLLTLYLGLALWGLEFVAVWLISALGFRSLVYSSEVASLLLYAPVILYVICCADAKTALRIRAFRIRDALLAVLLCLTAYLSVVYITNILYAWLAGLGATFPNYTVLEQLMTAPDWYTLLSLCVLAPVSEEFMMRGALLSGHARRGRVYAILLSGLIFGLMHGDPLRFVPTAIIGCLLALLVLKTGSIWVAIIYHAAHNFFSFASIENVFTTLPWRFKTGIPELGTAAGEALFDVYNLALFAICLIATALITLYLARRTPPTRDAAAEVRPRYTTALYIGIALLLFRVLISGASYFGTMQ